MKDKVKVSAEYDKRTGEIVVDTEGTAPEIAFALAACVQAVGEEITHGQSADWKELVCQLIRMDFGGRKVCAAKIDVEKMAKAMEEGKT